jgi:hypothetical protein
LKVTYEEQQMAVKFKSEASRILCRLVFEATGKDLISVCELFTAIAPEGYQPCGQDLTFRISATGTDSQISVKVLSRAKAREAATGQIVLLPTELLEELVYIDVDDVSDSGFPSPSTSTTV